MATILLLPSAAFAAQCPTFDKPQDIQALSVNAPPAFIEMPPPPVSEPFTLLVQFCGSSFEEPPKLEFDADMPAHQHGMNYDVSVEKLTSDTFRVSNIVFHMLGHWQLRFRLSAPVGEFDYLLDVTVE